MRKLKQNRSLLTYILLTIVTFGIYAIYFMWDLIRDTNEACKEDGQKTTGIIKYWLLSLITCGIYSIVWWYKIADRLNAHCLRNGLPSNVTGGSFLCWEIFGSMLCGIGPFVAMHKLIKTANTVTANYNAKAGL